MIEKKLAKTKLRKTEMIHFRLTLQERNMLDKQCINSSRSYSDIIRTSLLEKLNK